MSTEELGLAASTLWVVIAAVFVLFMQAGFAFLEAGLTRMKNVGHIAAKNALVLGIAAIVFYLVGFGIAFGDGGNGIVGGSGFFPSVDDMLAVGPGAVLVVRVDPGRCRAALPDRVRGGLPRDRLGRDGRAGPPLGLHRVRRRLHPDLLGRRPLGLER